MPVLHRDDIVQTSSFTHFIAGSTHTQCWYLIFSRIPVLAPRQETRIIVFWQTVARRTHVRRGAGSLFSRLLPELLGVVRTDPYAQPVMLNTVFQSNKYVRAQFPPDIQAARRHTPELFQIFFRVLYCWEHQRPLAEHLRWARSSMGAESDTYLWTFRALLSDSTFLETPWLCDCSTSAHSAQCTPTCSGMSEHSRTCRICGRS